MVSTATGVRIYTTGLSLRVNLTWKVPQEALELGRGFEVWAGYRWAEERRFAAHSSGMCMGCNNMRESLKIKADAAEEKALTEKILARRSGGEIWTGRMGTILWHVAWELLEISYKLSFCSCNNNGITKICLGVAFTVSKTSFI